MGVGGAALYSQGLGVALQCACCSAHDGCSALCHVKDPAHATRSHTTAAGNLAFVQSHAALVNTRRITFVNDVITMVPCPGTGVDGRGMPACNTKASQGGKVSVWTG